LCVFSHLGKKGHFSLFSVESAGMSIGSIGGLGPARNAWGDL
jgi:hypothetical protein